MNGSITIEQQCALIKKKDKSITSEQLKKSFDIITSELNKLQFPSSIHAIEKILASITIDENNIYSQCVIIDHRLFIIIRECYLNILCLWRTDKVLDDCSRTVFIETSLMFTLMCDQVTDVNINSLKQLLIQKSLIDELSKCLIDIATNEKYLHICAIDFMIRAIHRLSRRRLDIQDDPLLGSLLDATVQCICSASFINIFNQITELNKLNEVQAFFLDTCTDYVACYEGKRRHEIYSIIRMALLKRFTQWFQSHVSTFRQWNSLTSQAVYKLGIIMFDFGLQNDDLLSKDIYDDCCPIIDCFIFILTSLSTATIDESHIKITGICIFHLYAFTLEQDLLDFIKSKQLPSILLKLVDINNDEETQFNAYRILASIMTEQDIKMLTNPSKIANVFLTFLITVIDNPRKIRRLRNLLHCLKSLVQHDQIKDELIKQGILPVFIRCATETKFDPLKEQQPALEILLALTFNDQAAIALKNNPSFMSHLKTLLTSSSEEGIRRAAEGLIWKLEKEQTAISNTLAKSIVNDVINYKYDIMISYSHSDKDLCHRLHDRLIKDEFRVWLDRDYMHGATMVAMADAIENAQIVLICMSDKYKQSAYCQSEAHYAYERRCHLIPIIVKLNYRSDGWLGFIVSGKVYVDFPKLGFDQAYQQLKMEIDQYRKNSNQSISLPIQHQHDSSKIVTAVKSIEVRANTFEEQQTTTTTTRNLPHCIDAWTKDHVKLFLINANLDSLLPICATMNGRVLHHLYTMCNTNRESMFQKLKDDMSMLSPQEPIMLSTYLCFLDEIQPYIPRVPSDNSPISAICTLM